MWESEGICSGNWKRQSGSFGKSLSHIIKINIWGSIHTDWKRTRKRKFSLIFEIFLFDLFRLFFDLFAFAFASVRYKWAINVLLHFKKFNPFKDKKIVKPWGENHQALAVNGEKHPTCNPESESNPGRSSERRTCYHGATKPLAHRKNPRPRTFSERLTIFWFATKDADKLSGDIDKLTSGLNRVELYTVRSMQIKWTTCSYL